MTYEIKDIDGLESSTADLASSNQKIASDAASLTQILNEIRQSWENESGTDLQSILTELDDCIKKIQTAINPVVGKYVETMNTLVAESRTTQNKTL